MQKTLFYFFIFFFNKVDSPHAALIVFTCCGIACTSQFSNHCWSECKIHSALSSASVITAVCLPVSMSPQKAECPET